MSIKENKMKIKIFLSSRFNEFKDLREYIIQNGFKEIGLDIEIVALDKEPLANILSPKKASIEGVEISNIYMLFLGKTYGTTPRDDVVSVTHREYKVAKNLGLPVLVFLTNDEKREKKVEEFLKEIEESEIYGIISGDVKKDYKLVLKSLKEAILKLTHYGIKYVTKLNQVDFDLLEKKSEEFISDLGDRYIGNKEHGCYLRIPLKKEFDFFEKEYIFDFLNDLFYSDQFNSLKNLGNFIQEVPSYKDAFAGFKAYFGEDEEFPISENMVISPYGCQYLVSKIIEWLEINFYEELLDNKEKFDEFLAKLINKLSIIKQQIEIYEVLNLSDPRIESDKFYVGKMILSEYLKTIDTLINFKVSLLYKIFFKKQLLLKGEALIGKTHLFCEIAKDRLKNKKPTILFFGHQFKENKSIIKNMIDLLDIDISEEMFLESLNILGKKYDSRVLIMIDAVNETNGNLWKNEIISFSNKVKNYEYLALALSIRDVEENKLIDSSNENFIKENFEIIEHKGITLTLKDIEKICKCLRIEIINIPTHMFNLFVNPGIMWIYLENIQKTSKKVNIEDVISPLDLFESIFDSLSERFNNRYSVNDKDELLNALEEIIEFGLKDNFYFEIEKRKLKRKLKKENYDSNILDFLISEGILREENEKIYFRYQKFENYFVAKYLLESYEEKEILKKLIETNNEALLEAFVLLLPLKGVEIFDLDENLLQDEKIVKYFINSLIWRNKKLIKETTKKYLNKFIFNEFYKDEIFEMILHSSLIPTHPFNAEFLHNILKDLSIVKRDFIWSLFIHNSFENEKNVERIIEWVLDLKDEKLVFEKEIATFYGIILSWLFTSSNRKLRDLATKALVKIFVNNLEIIPDILEKFKEVNDLYVLERILAAIYGAVLIVKKSEEFYNIAKKLFEIVFKDRVIEHIMIRDYAYLTIDFIKQTVKLDFDISKIYPPYGSKLPDYFIGFECFEEKYENGYIRQIIRSMRTEDMGVMYGDFGRYTFQFAIKNFKQDIPFKNWSAKAVEFIIEKIIKDEVDIFEKAEKNLDAYSTNRYDHRVERIGKKYQWLAMHKILAVVADNFKVSDSFFWDKYVDYVGSWQIGIRDIDSTLFLSNKRYKPLIKIDFFNIDDENKWLESLENLDLKSKILFDDKIVLHTYILKEKKDYKTKDVFIHFDSFIIKKQDINKFTEWLENTNFEGKGPLLEATQGMTQIFIKEYPFSNVADYYKQDWCDKDGQLPSKILITYTRYLREFGNYDYSIDETQLVVLPNKFLMKSLNLTQTNCGVWSRDNKKIIYDLNMFLDTDFNECLVIDKDSLFEFIKNSEYTIIWIMWAEKRIYSYKHSIIDMKTFKYSEFIGYGYFDDDFEFFEKVRRVK